MSRPKGDPEAVAAFKRAIGTADALLIATPEYNHCVPGLLKNAIEWASRPARRSVLTGKPVAIMGATPGSGGTARAQAHLRDGLAYRHASLRSRRRRMGDQLDSDRGRLLAGLRGARRRSGLRI
jgi:NAD(P)H-dependent FMN reductase